MSHRVRCYRLRDTRTLPRLLQRPRYHTLTDMMAALDIIVAAALFELFAPVNRTLSTLAAWFRVAYAAVFLVAISQLVALLPVSGDAGQVQVRIQAFDDIWHTGLILFGIHLLLIGYLAYRSGFVPKVIGLLLVVAGLGYLTDSFAMVLLNGSSVSVAQFTFVGEVVLIFWLLIKGRRITVTSLTKEEDNGNINAE